MKVLSSRHAYSLLQNRFRKDVEEVWVVALSSNKVVIRSSMIFRGTVDQCLVHPRDIFRFLIQTNASAFLLAHNHPCGTLKPSREDLDFTQRISDLSRVMGIEFVDHIILGKEKYYSFLDSGKLRQRV